MTRFISFIFITAWMLIAGTQQAIAVETASQILSKCATKVNGAPSLEISFTLVASNQTSACKMTIAREMFKLSSPDMLIWYDGTTQWTYLKSKRELSITEPTAEELLESNPFAILNHYSQAYNCRRLAGNDLQVELVAKSKYATVRKAVIFIDNKSYLPTKLIVTLGNGSTFTATVNSSKVGTKQDSSLFKYNKAKYPAQEINDLR